MSPLRQTIVVDPGSSARIVVDVRNESTSMVTVRPIIDAYTIGDNGQAVFGQQVSALDWVGVEAERYQISAGETQSIPFIIHVPASAEPGGHYLALFMASDPAEGAVRVESRVGSLLMLYVAGEVIERLDVTTIQSPPVVRRMPSTVQLELKNTGTIHVVPEGDVLVRNWRGTVVTSTILNAKQRKVLPYASWTDSVIISSPSWSDVGPLTITANVSYGVTGQFVRAQKTIWYLPVRLYVVVATGIAIMILFVIGRRKYKLERN